MRRILILDDIRGINEACRGAGIKREERDCYTLSRPFHHDGAKVLNDYDDALSIVNNSPKFDVWILDNDLGPGVEGYEFFKECLESFPDKIPDVVKSCSANMNRRADIERHHANWLLAQKS